MISIIPLPEPGESAFIVCAMESEADIDDLYSLARAGNSSARERLYARLLVSFRVIARHRMWGGEDAEDVVQEALMAVAGSYESLKIESSFASWAHRVLNNKIVDHYRVNRVRINKMEELSRRHNVAGAFNPAPRLRTRIKNCFAKIHQVNRQHARILSLHFQGYSTDEICRRLGITRTNCYVSLSRARAMLEKCLNQEDQFA